MEGTKCSVVTSLRWINSHQVARVLMAARAGHDQRRAR